MKERTSARSAPRLPRTLEGTLVVGSGAEARILPIVTCDVGTGGASIESPEPLAAGTRATLHLVLARAGDGNPRQVELTAVVTRAEGDNPSRLALSFASARPAAIEALKRFIFLARDDHRR